MISEFFLNIVFGLVSGMLSVLPEIEWSMETSAFQYFLDIIRIAGYMLPMETVSQIISLVVGLTITRILISIPKTLWELLPLV